MYKHPPRMLVLLAVSLLSGCSATVYSVDDGSAVDETPLANIRTYGKGQQVLRPTIVKSAQLKDKDCSTQYELPFATAPSYELSKEKKLAWARGLGGDERLTVIAATAESGLVLGNHFVWGGGYKRDNVEKMLDEFASLRNSGRVFQLPLASARMKVYHYGLKMVKTGVTIASIASGVGAVANAAATAAASAATVAGTQAGRAAGQAALQAAGKAAAEHAAASLRQKALDALQTVAKGQLQAVALDSIKAASVFKDSLSGISWVAGTGFYMADKWALERMTLMGADPLAAYTLHYKLASNALAQNAFVFDEERLKLMSGLAEKNGTAGRVPLVLQGQDSEGPVAVVPQDANFVTGVTVTAIYAAVGDTTFDGAFALDPDHRTYCANGKVTWANGDVFVGELTAGRREGVTSTT